MSDRISKNMEKLALLRLNFGEVASRRRNIDEKANFWYLF